jgi:hypothetical protein
MMRMNKSPSLMLNLPSRRRSRKILSQVMRRRIKARKMKRSLRSRRLPNLILTRLKIVIL